MGKTINNRNVVKRRSCTPRAASYRAARDDAARVVQPATWQSYPPRKPPTESSSVFVRIPFSDPIFEGSFGGLPVNSKWVMQHIVGKLSTSTFQRYKFCANRSSDERVMAPGSRGAGAVFACFSGEDSGQTGKPPANRELHVVAGVVIFPTHPGPRVNLQRVGKTLRAKAVVREKNAPDLRSIFPRFLSVFARVFDLAPEVGFRRSWYRWKACATLSLKVLDLQETKFGFARYGSANRGHRSVFGPLEDIFPIEIPARPGKILAIREFHTVHECVLFPTYPGLRINLLPCTEASLGSQDMILRTEAELHVVVEVTLLLKSFSLRTKLPPVEKNPLLSITPSFLVRFQPVKYRVEALNVLHALVRGWSVRFSFRSGQQVRSNLGQTLVKLGQSSPNSGKCIPDHVLRVFWHSGPQSGQKRLGQTSVNLGQTWSKLSGLWEIYPGPRSEVI
uniref:Uncharacterized protein n=1 Tax=Fagus sylvatica TaxID=28930 RepID=A0A2N9ISB9_FAGSY